MKVILISTIANLGKIGDVVEVRNGYARNFLIPNKKAICFTESNNKIFEEQRQQFEQENQNSLDAANELRNNILGKNIIVIENASDDGRLYGSVNSGVIATKINELSGSNVASRNNIFLKKPIKEIGIYEVVLAPHSDVTFNVRVVVSRNESEVEVMLAEEKKNNKKAKAKKEEEISEEVAAA